MSKQIPEKLSSALITEMRSDGIPASALPDLQEMHHISTKVRDHLLDLQSKASNLLHTMLNSSTFQWQVSADNLITPHPTAELPRGYRRTINTERITEGSPSAVVSRKIGELRENTLAGLAPKTPPEKSLRTNMLLEKKKWKVQSLIDAANEILALDYEFSALVLVVDSEATAIGELLEELNEQNGISMRMWRVLMRMPEYKTMDWRAVVHYQNWKYGASMRRDLTRDLRVVWMEQATEKLESSMKIVEEERNIAMEFKSKGNEVTVGA